MKNPEISQDKKYPRFFVIFDEDKLKKYPIWDKISCVRVEGPEVKYKFIYKNGDIKIGGGDVTSCDKTVSKGIWREIPIEEVALL